MSSHAERIPVTGTAEESRKEAATSEPILPRISSPAQLHDLSLEELKQLSVEVRQRIIEVIAKGGGHFGSPLGAVDISVALLHVFNLPEDRVVWDVGHQAYAWKILTGRNDRFETIRQYKGLSGFLKRAESEYDSFGAGHASTSIAAAYGMAKARDLQKKDHKVVAVIGDGAMTGGMAYEALNNAGHTGTGMLVIFNDNEMSISENVWSVHKGLSRLITSSHYNTVKKDIKKVLRTLMGERVIATAHNLEEALKGLMVPGLFFEELGFRYIGPIDGHNMDELVPILQRARELDGPICVHVVTKKGKGYSFAENDPLTYHAAANMKIETGEMTKTPAPPAYTKIFGKTLVELGNEDDQVVAITAAMPTGTGTDQFAKAHPDRHFDVGIAEECAVTMAAGMAADGLKPFCCIYSTFLQRAFDQIVHDCAIQHLPVRFVLDRGGLVGADGPTHHGVLDLSYLRIIQDLIVMAPRNEQELRRMLRTQLEYDKGPSAMRYPRGNASGKIDLDNLDYPAIEIGKGEVLREGERIALLGIGKMVDYFERTADILEEKLGHPVTVADARFVKPLDEEMIRDLAANHEFLFTAEDNSIVGGFGSAVNEFLSDDGTNQRAIRFGLPDRFIDHGKPDELFREIGLMPDQMADQIMERVGE